jgi:hypothetical protein
VNRSRDIEQLRGELHTELAALDEGLPELAWGVCQKRSSPLKKGPREAVYGTAAVFVRRHIVVMVSVLAGVGAPAGQLQPTHWGTGADPSPDD